jgi:hypothetical protein
MTHLPSLAFPVLFFAFFVDNPWRGRSVNAVGHANRKKEVLGSAALSGGSC